MVNFSLGWPFCLARGAEIFLWLCDKFHLGWNISHFVSYKAKSLYMFKLAFQPGLILLIARNFFKFFSPFALAWNPSLVFKTGLGFSARAKLRPGLSHSPCIHQFDFMRISFRSQVEISVWLTRLRFQPRLKFAM